MPNKNFLYILMHDHREGTTPYLFQSQEKFPEDRLRDDDLLQQIARELEINYEPFREDEDIIIQLIEDADLNNIPTVTIQF